MKKGMEKLEEIFWCEGCFKNSEGTIVYPKPKGYPAIIWLTVNNKETNNNRIKERINIDPSYKNLNINAYAIGLSAHDSAKTAVSFFEI